MGDTIQRTFRVPLVRPDDDTWRLLRAVACKAARFGNMANADIYTARVNGLSGNAVNTVQNGAYKRMNDELSGWVRGAMMQNRVRGYWTRSGKDVLAGRERLACFSADRALSISGDQAGNNGVLYERDAGGQFVLVCRFEPVEIRDEAGKLVGRREPVRLTLALESTAARRDWYIREAVEAIWSGAWRPGVVTFRFDRRRRTVDALISCRRPRPPEQTIGCGATLGPYDPDTGELTLRFDSRRRPVAFGHAIHHMRNIKETHDGLTRRLRRSLGRGGWKVRRKLDAVGHYSTWARGKMHELSAHIVKACRAANASTLRVLALGEGDLPWHELTSMLKYKCEQNGIAFEQPSVKQDATYRAKKAVIGKRTRKIRKLREGLSAAKDLMRADGENAA